MVSFRVDERLVRRHSADLGSAKLETAGPEAEAALPAATAAGLPPLGVTTRSTTCTELPITGRLSIHRKEQLHLRPLEEANLFGHLDQGDDNLDVSDKPRTLPAGLDSSSLLSLTHEHGRRTLVRAPLNVLRE